MAGRRAKPIALHLMDGKKHLTKEEIEARQQQEAALRTNTPYRPNKKVMGNPAALAMFRKLKKLYKSIEYIEGLDENVINRYCLISAEVDGLEKLITRMQDDIDECDEPADRIRLYKTISEAEITVNRMRDMLLKMEDRLFLNPTSRVKNVPHKEKEEPRQSKWAQYGNRQGN